jgi:hypothetical protein
MLTDKQKYYYAIHQKLQEINFSPFLERSSNDIGSVLSMQYKQQIVADEVGCHQTCINK